jgi:hypothetical protein
MKQTINERRATRLHVIILTFLPIIDISFLNRVRLCFLLGLLFPFKFVFFVTPYGFFGGLIVRLVGFFGRSQ